MTVDDDLALDDLLPGVQFYLVDGEDDSILSKVCPDHVIFYHYDVAFSRKVEIFQV